MLLRVHREDLKVRGCNQKAHQVTWVGWLMLPVSWSWGCRWGCKQNTYSQSGGRFQRQVSWEHEKASWEQYCILFFFFKLECDYFMMCFCFTTKWINHMYTYVPSLELPSFPILDVVTLAVTQWVPSHIHAEGWYKALHSFTKRRNFTVTYGKHFWWEIYCCGSIHKYVMSNWWGNCEKKMST